MRNNRNSQHMDFGQSRKGEERRETRRWVRDGKAAFLFAPIDSRI